MHITPLKVAMMARLAFFCKLVERLSFDYIWKKPILSVEESLRAFDLSMLMGSTSFDL